MSAAATRDDAPKHPSRWSGIVPAVRWLRSYKPAWFRADLAASVTLAAYLLPATLGDASLANLPPQAGLYACLFGGWFSGSVVLIEKNIVGGSSAGRNGDFRLDSDARSDSDRVDQ